MFYIKDFTKAYDSYKIYVAPYNGKIWGNYLDSDDAKYLIDVFFIQSDFIVPNMPPFFESPLMIQTFMISTDPDEFLIYNIPKILDSSANSTISVKVSGL